RNQSTGFSGEGLCAPRSDGERARQSRVTQGHLEMGEAGLGGREGTPERRAPGQVVRANLRPKDHLSGGCIASETCEWMNREGLKSYKCSFRYHSCLGGPTGASAGFASQGRQRSCGHRFRGARAPGGRAKRLGPNWARGGEHAARGAAFPA
ncbi:unnamed protein product, partial [Durusdinium trenchii]